MEGAICVIIVAIESAVKFEHVRPRFTVSVLDLNFVDFGDRPFVSTSSPTFLAKPFWLSFNLNAFEDGISFVCRHGFADGARGDVLKDLVGIGFVDVEEAEGVRGTTAPTLKARWRSRGDVHRWPSWRLGFRDAQLVRVIFWVDEKNGGVGYLF